jgi:uncharacterized membrane protein
MSPGFDPAQFPGADRHATVQLPAATESTMPTATADSKVHLNEEDRSLLHTLRHRSAHRRRNHPQAPLLDLPRSFGARIADAVANAVGSWYFILIQSTLLVAWLIGNVVSGPQAWDPYPFILLNLLLSFQAAYTAPVIMMSQNRLSDIDRRHAEEDYRVNVKAELEIELLHQKIDLLREQELLALTRAVEALSEKIAGAAAKQA